MRLPPPKFSLTAQKRRERVASIGAHLRILLSARMWVCLFSGFSSGMPYFVLYEMLPAQLRDQGIDLKTIGLFALVALPYQWKFLWSPLMDRIISSRLGRRRGWALLVQTLLFLSLLGLGFFSPEHRSLQPERLAVIAFLVALFSASQDIVLDAYRRERLKDEELGLGSALFVNAWRLSKLIPGSLALILADRLPWKSVHFLVAAFMAIGILTTLFMQEPQINDPPQNLRASIIEPFREFFIGRGFRSAFLIMAFMFLYKIGDNLATALSTPFYLDLGYSKTEIGTVGQNRQSFAPQFWAAFWAAWPCFVSVSTERFGSSA